MSPFPVIEMPDGNHLYPDDRISLVVEEDWVGKTRTDDGLSATFIFFTNDPLPMRVKALDLDDGHIVCERTDVVGGYIHIDQDTFVRYVAEGKILQMVRPLYPGPHRFINRFTEVEEKILYATPRRDSRTRQFGYVVESLRRHEVEHLFLTEKQLLNRAKPATIQPEGVTP